MDSLGPDSEQLRHWKDDVAWLRGLAARLVRDPDEAADLAGDVWVAALERRPDVSENRSLRPWLSVVLQRLVARRRREGRSRREREHSAARTESVHGADRAIEQVELQRVLAEAVLALEEPYRSAVVLRHLEQLSPANIAQRQKCSVEAARQRVTRGLQQLRARLDREFDGGRDTWRALLIPFAQHVPLGGASLLAGVSLMGTKSVLGAAAGIAAACLWLWAPWDSAQSAQLASREQDRALSVLEIPSTRETLDQPTVASASQATARRALAGPLRVAGTVLDSNGRPLTRAHLDFSSPDDEATLAPSAVSDASGHFESLLATDWPSDKPIDALVRAAGFVVTSVFLQAGEPAQITLRRLPRIEVHVSTSDGSIPQGVVNLLIAKPAPEKSETERVSVDLDADGVARSGPVGLGRLQLVGVDAAGFCTATLRRSDELVGDLRLEIEVSLAPGVTLRGVVLNELTQRPVPDALVRTLSDTSSQQFGQRAALTDHAGRFELRGVSPSDQTYVADMPTLSALYRVEVEAQGFRLPRDRRVVLKHAANRSAPALVEGIELLVIPAGGSLSGNLHWSDGRECGGSFRVRAVDSAGNLFEARSAGACGFFFEALPADELHVFATPHLSNLGPCMANATLRLGAGEQRELDLVLEKGSAVIEGRVLDGQGNGLAWVDIEASSYFEQSVKRTWLDNTLQVTDAQGYFRFEGLSPGVYEVIAEVSGTQNPQAGWPPQRRLTVEAAQVHSSVDFRVESAVRYGGKLAPWPAPDPAQPVLLELTHAEFGKVAAVWVREDGSFYFPPVFGANYVLVARQGEREWGRLSTPAVSVRDLVVMLGK